MAPETTVEDFSGLIEAIKKEENDLKDSEDNDSDI
jgi:hypothetical protein